MRIRSAFPAILALAIAAACRDPSAWALEGSVSFVGLRERTDASGNRIGSLDYSIVNEGRSRIEGTRFAFRFATDGNVYRGTVVDGNAIAAGAFVYGAVAIAYDGPGEAGTLAGAVVESVQFE